MSLFGPGSLQSLREGETFARLEQSSRRQPESTQGKHPVPYPSRARSLLQQQGWKK